MPRVSVIVNTVDRVEDLKKCLDSILKQKFEDFEVVVINNGVGEEAKGFLEEFKTQNFHHEAGSRSREKLKIKIVEDRTKKLSYLFNLGWRSTDPRSDYLVYLADDTEADPLYLNESVGYLDQHPEVTAVSGPVLSTADPPGEMNYLYDLAKKNFLTKIFLRIYEYFVMEGRLFEPGHWCESGAFTLGAGIPQPEIKEPVAVDLLTSTSMVIRRSALSEVGGFDENFLFNHADGDLFIRLKKAGQRLVFHPAVKVLHHQRFGPTRYPEILGRDTAFYFLKDVRPKSLRGLIGLLMNLSVFNAYFIFKAIQLRRPDYLKGLSGFVIGVFDFFRTKSRPRDELGSQLLVVSGFLIIFGLAFRNLWHYGMLAYGDATPFPENFSQAFRFFFKAFDPRSPQIINPQDGAILSSLVPLEALLALIFGGNFLWAQRFFYFLPIPLAFISIYFFLSQLTASRPARFLTAFLYSANHFMVAEFAGGFAGNLYIPALLPFFLMLLKKIHDQLIAGDSFRQPWLVFSALLTVTYVISDHVFFILFPFWLIFIFAPVFTQKAKRLKEILRRVIILGSSLLWVVLLSAYHFYNHFKLAWPYLGGRNLPEDIIPFFVSNIWDTYWRMTLGNTLRLGGSYFSDFYLGGSLWDKLGFLIPVLALAWPFFKKNRLRSRLKIAIPFTLGALGAVLIIFLTSRGITLSIFKALPILFRFRNPSRLSLFLAFLYTPLIALTLDGWFRLVGDWWQKRRRFLTLASLLVTSLLVFSLAYYFKGFFSGDFTLKQHRDDRFYISQRYYQLAEFISKEHYQQPKFRTLYLPWNHEETEAKLLWLDPDTFSVPITYGAYVRNDYLNFLQSAYRQVAEGKANRLGEALASGGVKFVVLNSESLESGAPLFRFDYQTPWLLGSFSDYQKIIARQVDLKLVTEIGGFDVYENLDFSPQKIDDRNAGFYMDNLERETRLRRILISVAVVSWFSWLLFFWGTRSRFRKAWYFLTKNWVTVGFLILVSVSTWKLWSYPMLAYGDATPFPNNFGQAFRFFFQSFDPRMPSVMMPQASVILSTLVPLESFLALLFGGNFIWAQKVFYFLPIPLSFVTIYFFVSQFISSKTARFITAFVYSSNHFMVGEFAGGFAGNLYVPALLPLLIYCLYRLYRSLWLGSREQILKYLIYYSILQAVAYVLSDHVLFLLAPFWLIFILAPLTSPSSSRFRMVWANVLVLLFSFGISLMLSAYHAVGYFKIALPFLSHGSLPNDLIPFFVQNIWDTYWAMTPGNVLRLGGSYFKSFYQGSEIWAKIGFLIPILAFSWLFFARNRKGRRLKVGLFFSLLAAVIILTISLTARGATIAVFESLPALFRFRNPSRLSLFLAFVYSPLIALTLDAWLSHLSDFWRQKKKFLSTLFFFLTLLIVGGLAYYHKGFFSGDFTLAQHRDRSFYISSRYYRLADFLNQKRQGEGLFRTAYFPWNHEDAEMKLFWLDPYALGVPIEYGAYVQNDYLKFIETVYQRVDSDRMEGFGNLLARGGVAYLVVNSRPPGFGRASYQYAYHVPWLLGSFDDINRIISSSRDLKYLVDVDGFKVYQNLKFSREKIDDANSQIVPESTGPDLGRLFWLGLTLVSWLLTILVLFRFALKPRPILESHL